MSFNKMIVLAMALIMALPMAFPSAFAITSDNAFIGGIRIGDYGVVRKGMMDTYVHITNTHAEDTMYNGKLQVFLIDENTRDTISPIKIRAQESAGKTMYIDTDDVAPGEYLAKIVFTADDGVRRVKYRYVEIE